MIKTERIILTPTLAKHLLALGFRIVDLKPHKEDYKRTVFVFENCDALALAVNEYKYKIKNADLMELFN